MMAHRKAIGVVVGMLLLAGCQGPMQRSFDDRLRERMASDHRQLLQAVSPREVHEVTREESEVEGSLSESRRRELDDMSGPKAYEGAALPLGEDLMGDPETPVVQMTLEQAVRMTVEHNLSVEQARLRPAIDEAQIVQAEAVFDAALFANVDFQKLDTPRPAQAGIAIPTLGSRQSTSASFAYGIRKATQTGGQITIQSTISREEDTPPGTRIPPSTARRSRRRSASRCFGTSAATSTGRRLSCPVTPGLRASRTSS